MGSFNNPNDRWQEFFLIVGDKLQGVSKKSIYILAIGLVALVPAYYAMRTAWAALFLQSYVPPEIVYQAPMIEPLQIIEKKIFKLTDNTYSGMVRIKNINLDWGVANQGYHIEFKSLGGTILNQLSDRAFILPASEKIIVIPRFTTDKEPTELNVRLDINNFVKKSSLHGSIGLNLERVSINSENGEFYVSAGVKNISPFTIRQVGLPVLLFNSTNNIVGANYTSINDLEPNETRTFRVIWPTRVAGSVRAEVLPEINYFETVIILPDGTSPFDDLQEDIQ